MRWALACCLMMASLTSTATEFSIAPVHAGKSENERQQYWTLGDPFVSSSTGAPRILLRQDADRDGISTIFDNNHDIIAPFIQSIVVAEDRLKIGDPVNVAVLFNEPIFFDGTNSLISLNLDGQLRDAAFLNVSDNTVTYQYIVAEGDSATSGLSLPPNALTLNGDVITDANANQAMTTTTELLFADTPVDGIAPFAYISSDAQVTADGPFNVYVVFSESVNAFSLSNISVDNGIIGGLIQNNETYVFTFEPQYNGQVTVTINQDQVSDAFGNTNKLSVPLQLDALVDEDGDSIVDWYDNCPSFANSEQADLDLDGAGDECDADDDNDGIEDIADAFPRDAFEFEDTDGDGIGNVADTDDDGDGIADADDPDPLVAGESEVDPADIARWRVEAAASKLSFADIKGLNELAGFVTSPLALPASFDGEAVEWISRSTLIDVNSGIVNRDIARASLIEIEAIIGNPDEIFARKSISLTIIPSDANAQELLDHLTKALAIGELLGQQQAQAIVADLFLPRALGDEATVNWLSSNPEVISTDGYVTRPEFSQGNQHITLSATIDLHGVLAEKQFHVTVPYKPSQTSEQSAQDLRLLTAKSLLDSDTAHPTRVPSRFGPLPELGVNGEPIEWQSNDEPKLTLSHTPEGIYAQMDATVAAGATVSLTAMTGPTNNRQYKHFLFRTAMLSEGVEGSDAPPHEIQSIVESQDTNIATTEVRFMDGSNSDYSRHISVISPTNGDIISNPTNTLTSQGLTSRIRHDKQERTVDYEIVQSATGSFRATAEFRADDMEHASNQSIMANVSEIDISIDQSGLTLSKNSTHPNETSFTSKILPSGPFTHNILINETNTSRSIVSLPDTEFEIDDEGSLNAHSLHLNDTQGTVAIELIQSAQGDSQFNMRIDNIESAYAFASTPNTIIKIDPDGTTKLVTTSAPEDTVSAVVESLTDGTSRSYFHFTSDGQRIVSKQFTLGNQQNGFESGAEFDIRNEGEVLIIEVDIALERPMVVDRALGAP